MSPAEEPIVAPQSESGPVILVAEDEVMIRLAISEHLRSVGLTVIEAVVAPVLQLKIEPPEAVSTVLPLPQKERVPLICAGASAPSSVLPSQSSSMPLQTSVAPG